MPILPPRLLRAVTAALAAFLASAAGAPPAVPPAPPVLAAGPPGFATLAARLLPAVVNIAATTAPQTPHHAGPGNVVPFDKRFHDFMRGLPPGVTPALHGTQSLGSGFIIDPTGLIVTSNHVIAGASRIVVTLQDGTVLAARVAGRDRAGDLALLQVKAGHPLPIVRWGNSAAAHIGNWVLAIGNPFGLGGTVTAGIISARGRDIHDGPYDDFIQTDAPINRGNSGGPLFNLAGQVIGVNTAIYSPSGGSIGIGFAIPSDIARTAIAQLRRYGRPRRGWLGLQAEAVTADIARTLGLPGVGGALVATVAPDGPAAVTGLRAGDVILRLGGVRLNARTLPRLIAEAAPGTGITLLVWRDGQQLNLRAQLGARPDVPRRPATSAGTAHLATPAARAHRGGLH